MTSIESWLTPPDQPMKENTNKKMTSFVLAYEFIMGCETAEITATNALRAT